MSLLISFFLLFSIKNVSALQSDITSSTLLFVLSMNLNQQINKHTDRHSRIYVFRHTRQMTFSLSRLIVCGCQLVSFRFILFLFLCFGYFSLFSLSVQCRFLCAPFLLFFFVFLHSLPLISFLLGEHQPKFVHFESENELIAETCRLKIE